MKRGDRLGPYEILDLLGKGAMGEVYLARHPELGHEYAVKVLSAVYSDDAIVAERFEREMAALAQVGGHPGIVRVHSGGRTQDQRAYYAMEYVRGTSLKQALKTGALTHAQKVYAVECVADALSWAHKQGVVHRDVKPENILIGDDHVIRLTDFGLALSNTDMNRRLTMTGDMVGTPVYMAPEQVTPALGEVGPHSDVFALGTILYEILTGRPPYMAKTAVEVYTKLMEGEPIPAPSAVVVEGSGELVPDPPVEAICMRALEREPGARYAEAGALRDALRAAREGEAAGDGGSGAPRALLLAASLSLVVCVFLLGVVAVRRSRGEAVASPEQVTRLAAMGKVDEAWAMGYALRAEGVRGLDEVLAEVGAKRAQAAWAAGDVEGTRAVLDAGVALAPFAQLPFLRAVVQGDPAAAHGVDGLDPAEAARYAAWAGDQSAVEAALARLTQADQRRALAWSLRPFVPGLRPPQGSLRASSVTWASLAAAEEALGRGLVDVAQVAAAAAERDARSRDQRLAAGLTAARVALARGDLDGCATRIDQVWDKAESALDRARCAGWAIRLGRLHALGSLAARASDWQALAATYPGLPAARVDADGLVPGLTAVAAARRDPAAAEALAATTQATARGSWIELERELCLRGFDGPAGLWLADAALAAGRAERGFDPDDAQAAGDELARLARLRPRSAWLHAAQGRAALARAGDALDPAPLESARAACQQALDRAPDDPVAALLEARVAWARAVPALRAADLARLGELAQVDPALERAALEAAAQAADAFAPLLGDDRPHPARAWGQVWAARARAQALRHRARLDGLDAVSAALGQVADGLGPMVDPTQLERLDGARRRAGEALERGDAGAALEALGALRPPEGVEREAWLAALALYASLGQSERSEQAARIYLGVTGDRPALAFLAVRRAEAHPETGARRVAEAAALAPDLPELRLERRLREPRFAASPEAYLDLAWVAWHAPARAPLVVALLRDLARDSVELPAAPGSTAAERATHALALALHGLQAGDSDGALAAVAHASRALALHPPAELGARLIRASALLALGGDFRGAAMAEVARVLVARPSDAGAHWLRALHVDDPLLRRRAVDQLLGQGYLQSLEPLPLSRVGLHGDLVEWLPNLLSGEILDGNGDAFDPWDPEDHTGLANALQQATPQVTDDRGRPALPRLALGLRLHAGQLGLDGLDASMEDLYVVLGARHRARARALHDCGWWRWGRGDDDDDDDRWPQRRGAAEELARLAWAETTRPAPWPRGWSAWRGDARGPERARTEDRVLPRIGSLDGAWARVEEPAALTYALADAWYERPGRAEGWRFTAAHLFEPWSRARAVLEGAADPLVTARATDWWADRRDWQEAVWGLLRAAAFDPSEDCDAVLLEETFDELHDRFDDVVEDLPEGRDGALAFVRCTEGLSHLGEALARRPGRALGFRILRAGSLLDRAALVPDDAAALRAAARRLIDAFTFRGEDLTREDHNWEWEHYGRWYRVRVLLGGSAEELAAAAEAFLAWYDASGRDWRRRIRRIVRADIEVERVRAEPALKTLVERVLDDEDGRRRGR